MSSREVDLAKKAAAAVLKFVYLRTMQSAMILRRIVLAAGVKVLLILSDIAASSHFLILTLLKLV